MRGIEWIVAAEVQSRLDVRRIRLGHREVRFSTAGVPAPSCLQLASADDVFMVVGTGVDVDHTRASLARFTEIAAWLSWDRAMRDLERIRTDAHWTGFSVSASALGRRNYSRFEIEDAVAEGAERALGLPYRPTRAPMRSGSELAIRVHLADGGAIVALRIFDRPLHRRSYKRDTTVATLHPPLAAAMCLLAGLHPNGRMVDPFVGAGTILIEGGRLETRLRCFGADLSGASLDAASRNARRADRSVALVRADAASSPWRDEAFSRVVTNVPWGRAVEPGAGLLSGWRARDEVIARILEEAGRAVLLVDGADPWVTGDGRRGALRLRHRSWLSLRGRHPRLCVVDRGAGQAIDRAGKWGVALSRWHGRADTREA